MSRVIQKGATDRSVILRAIDSTDGTPETGFAYNTSGIDLWYRREGGAIVSITEASLSAVDSAHSDGGVIHLGNGYFRLDAPDAAFATGANSVMFGGTATGMIIIGTEIQLVNYNPEDGVRLGLTALPNANADAAGGLPISDAGGLDLDTQLATLTNGTYGLSAIETLVDDLESRLTATRAGYLDNLSAGAVALASGVTVTTNNDKTGYTASTVSDKTGYSLSVTPPTASDIATAVWAAGTRTMSSFGTLVADVATAVWGAVARTITGGTITTNSDKTGYTLTGTDLADIKAKTDQLTFTTPGSVDATATVDTSDLATSANQTIIINHLTDVKGATFSGATDSLEAIRNRGDVAWITGGTGGGSNAVTINVKDDNAANVVDCYVEVWDSAGTSFISRTTTNSSGNATFNLENGTYTVKMHKAGYYFVNQSMEVGSSETFPYTGTILTPTAPTDPSLCKVYGYYFDPSGNTFPAIKSMVKMSVAYEAADNNYYVESINGTYNTTTGELSFNIVQGADAILDIPFLNIKKRFTVPAETLYKISDII